MGWAGVTFHGHLTSLILMEKGVKINQPVYLGMLSDDVIVDVIGEEDCQMVFCWIL